MAEGISGGVGVGIDVVNADLNTFEGISEGNKIGIRLTSGAQNRFTVYMESNTTTDVSGTIGNNVFIASRSATASQNYFQTLRVGDGSAGGPAISFDADQDLGFTRGGANNLLLMVGGSVRLLDMGPGLLEITGAIRPEANDTRDLGAGSLSWRSIYLGTAAVFGGTPASAGEIRFPTSGTFNFRNNVNSADVNGLSKDASDVVQVGGTAGIRINGGSALTTSNQTGTGNLALAISPTLTTPNIGAATGTSLNLGGATLLDVLTGSASLDFTALAANSCEVLTVTVTGAADGDTVSLGVPNALADVDGATERTTVFAWVSAPDTVSVRRCNITRAPTTDPAAAKVRATVVKF